MHPKFALFELESPKKQAPYIYPNAFTVQQTSGPDRLLIAPSAHHIDVMLSLIQILPEPFGIMYVLLMPRGRSAERGRYASPAPSSRLEVEHFLKRFQDAFESDGRHHVWVLSLQGSGVLVYDNHNVIYAYGPLTDFKIVLAQQGLTEQQVKIPYPHMHDYNPAYDDAERAIMKYWQWRYSPLLEVDDDDVV